MAVFWGSRKVVRDAVHAGLVSGMDFPDQRENTGKLRE